VIRVCVAGVTGWTGSAVAAAVDAAEDLALVAGISRTDPESFSSATEALDAVAADVLVDYTHATVVKANTLAAIQRGVAVVVGSSGMSVDDYAEVDAAAQAKGVGVIAAGWCLTTRTPTVTAVGSTPNPSRRSPRTGHARLLVVDGQPPTMTRLFATRRVVLCTCPSWKATPMAKRLCRAGSIDGFGLKETSARGPKTRCAQRHRASWPVRA